MSDRTLQATITAVDKASPTFAKVADGAAKMGKSAEQAGQQATRSFRDMEKAGRDVGIGIAALGAAFVLASRSAVDQARQIDAINRLYGDSADQILQLSEAIQDNTNFSNDAARQAAITGATLASNYQLSAEQIGVLIERSADLAAIHGIDLADAMTRVSGAIRGEGEAAELLGLNMSDSATALAAHAAGLTGWTTTMTEAEKAAFRYQLVLQQTTATQGAAADAADTTRGRVREIADTVQDAAQGFAAWTGPIGEATAALSDNALEIVVVGGGLVKLVSGLRAAGAASALASAAMGPAGLVVAIGAAAAAVILLSDHLGGTYSDAVHQAAAASGELVDVLARLASGGSEFALVGAEWRAGFVAQASAAADLGGAIKALEVGIAKLREAQKLPGVDNQAQINQMGAQLEKLYVLRAQFGSTEDAAREYGETLEAIGAIAAHIGPGQDQIVAKATELYDAFTTHKIGAKEYGDAIQDLAGSMGRYDAEALKATQATKDTGAAIEQSKSAAERSAGRWKEYDDAIRAARVTETEHAAATEQSAAAAERSAQRWKEYDDAIRQARASEAEQITALHGLSDATTGVFGNLEEGVTALHGIADATAGTLGPLEEGVTALHGIEEATAGLFDSAALGATALERLANGSRDAADALGGFKEIQDGIIGQQDVFNQQFGEYGSQISAIERAQEILNQRRAEGQQLQQGELDFLNEAPAALERLTGGQEDAAVSAGELAVKYGENMSLGDQLNQSLGGTTDAVGGLAASIDALTVALGGVPPETHATVSVDGADEGEEKVAAVRGEFESLDDTSANPDIAVVGDGTATAAVASVQTVLDALAGSSANPSVGVIDNASGTLSSVANQLAALDGASATAFINTVTTNTTNNITNDIHKTGFRHGGIVPHEYARHGLATHGWTAITVGEAGRETILAPGGSYVRNAAATAAMGSGTGGGITLNVNVGEVNGLAGVEEFASALASAVQRRWASLGM